MEIKLLVIYLSELLRMEAAAEAAEKAADAEAKAEARARRKPTPENIAAAKAATAAADLTAHEYTLAQARRSEERGSPRCGCRSCN
jgi:hypothetical protein